MAKQSTYLPMANNSRELSYDDTGQVGLLDPEYIKQQSWEWEQYHLNLQEFNNVRWGFAWASVDNEPATLTTVSISMLGRPMPNRCDRHDVVWGDDEHEGCGSCTDESRDGPDWIGGSNARP